MMECNKDEAVRAKEIAEKKFMGKDYAGAKKFALKAQSLCTDLEGLPQMLSVFDVYISAENRVSSGEVDWYCVLGVTYWADDKTVRKQYHKLALMIHPDKNKSIGADGAFKLVQEAWVLLSDKEKRVAYNQKLNQMGQEQKVSSHTEVPSAKYSANGFHSQNTAATSHTRTQNKNTRSRPAASQCMTRQLYPRVYLNQNMQCSYCHQHFLAAEKVPPSKDTKSPQNSRNHAANTNPYSSHRNGSKSSGCEVFGARSSTNGPEKVTSTSTAENVFQEPDGLLKKTDDLLMRAHQLMRAQDELKSELKEVVEWERHTCKRMNDLACGVEQHCKRTRV